MDSSDRDKLELLHERIKMQVPACINYSFEYLSVLQQSISAGTIIEIEYKNNKEEVSKRSIEPIGLLFYALNWHLIGWCHLRGDYRDFRVSRITRLCNTGKKFTTTDHTDLDTYMRTLPVNY
jgi:predicted DNA-binding transcriptional regulator YafY